MAQTSQSFEGKGAVITGAGRGIGRAIALGFARAGAAICCASRTEKEIQETAVEIRKEGGQAVSIRTDVGQWDDARNSSISPIPNWVGLTWKF